MSYFARKSLLAASLMLVGVPMASASAAASITGVGAQPAPASDPVQPSTPPGSVVQGGKAKLIGGLAYPPADAPPR